MIFQDLYLSLFLFLFSLFQGASRADVLPSKVGLNFNAVPTVQGASSADVAPLNQVHQRCAVSLLIFSAKVHLFFCFHVSDLRLSQPTQEKRRETSASVVSSNVTSCKSQARSLYFLPSPRISVAYASFVY